jgi:hypothetical protein
MSLKHAILRRTAWAVLISFLSLVSQPLQAAMQMQQSVKSGKIVKGGKALNADKAVVPHAPRPAEPGYKSAFMILAGAAETSIFKFYGVLGAVISLELQLIDLWYSCGDKEFAMYMAATFIVASVMIFALLSFAGPWLGLILGFVLGRFLDYLSDLVKKAPLCTKP